MKKFLAVIIILVLAFSLAACSILNDAAKLTEYDFGNDKIPTINSHVGDRKVTHVEVGTNNGSPQKQYTYQSDTVFDDLLAYTLYLRENSWMVTQDYDLEKTPGSAQLGKESADEGKILIMSIAFEENKYAVKITKMDGTLSVK